MSNHVVIIQIKSISLKSKTHNFLKSKFIQWKAFYLTRRASNFYKSEFIQSKSFHQSRKLVMSRKCSLYVLNDEISYEVW